VVIEQPDNVVAEQLQKFLAKVRQRPSGALTSE
jgi:hypothetical protein